METQTHAALIITALAAAVSFWFIPWKYWLNPASAIVDAACWVWRKLRPKR